MCQANIMLGWNLEVLHEGGGVQEGDDSFRTGRMLMVLKHIGTTAQTPAQSLSPQLVCWSCWGSGNSVSTWPPARGGAFVQEWCSMALNERRSCSAAGSQSWSICWNSGLGRLCEPGWATFQYSPPTGCGNLMKTEQNHLVSILSCVCIFVSKARISLVWQFIYKLNCEPLFNKQIQ